MHPVTGANETEDAYASSSRYNWWRSQGSLNQSRLEFALHLTGLQGGIIIAMNSKQRLEQCYFGRLGLVRSITTHHEMENLAFT